MGYQIGQYRFENRDRCLLDIHKPGDPDDKTVWKYYKESLNNAGAFRDVAIRYNKKGEGNEIVGFSADKDYYLRVRVPQDMNYTLEMNLKLIKPDANGDKESHFQNLDHIVVPKGGTGENSYRVVLFKSYRSTPDNEIVKVAIAQDYVGATSNQLDVPYYDKETKKYYLGTGVPGTAPVSFETLGDPEPYNDVFIEATWRQKYGDNYPYAFFDLVFRPLEDGFTDIVLEIVRSSDDWNIMRTEPDPDTGEPTNYYGRIVPLDQVQVELCEVRNLLNLGIKKSPLSQIGVHSHSGLLMCINGEAIRVGPNRFYELSAIPITSLGIVAKGHEDMFSIDYKYEE